MHFDWSTLVLQTVNVLVLLWLLRRFLFRPVVAIVAERKAAAEKLLSDAAAVREEAQAQRAEAVARDQALTADRDHVLADAHSAAETERAALLAQARQEVTQTREAARITQARENADMRQALEAEAQDLAVTIVSRLLGRLPSGTIDTVLMQSLDGWVGSLHADDLRGLTEDDGPLVVTTSGPLSEPVQAMLRQRLGDGTLQFKIDPSLILGIEVMGVHACLRNNWRADLDRIAKELKQDDKPIILA
ncbi:MAG TPA: hypothetical protein DDZ81_01175 [Acetobacteraceae bacterium]|jgi:F-type H+-transporting ATPase subunit b|nr:hypothetical protein [Acetobacteraceae bacterium]